VNERGSLPTALFAGFALSCVGGPLALAAGILPDAVGGPAIPAMGLTVLAGAALFGAPLLIWWRYSEEIASDGGLYAFVERAAGRRVALVQGCIWTFSYFLYLPFTVTYLVYEQLPESFPAVGRHQTLLELAVPVAISLLLILGERLAIILVAITAVVQVVLTLVLAAVIANHTGIHPAAFTPHSQGQSVARGIGNVALVFTCASLPLFLGGEVSGGGRTVRRTILLRRRRHGGAAAGDGGTHGRARRIEPGDARGAGLHADQGVRGQRPCERHRRGRGGKRGGGDRGRVHRATRLMRAMLGVSVPRAARVIAVLFVAGDALSLISPKRSYTDALTPSLVALYISQAIVFLAYLRFRRRPSALDWVAVAAATGLAVFGLEVVIAQQPYS